MEDVCSSCNHSVEAHGFDQDPTSDDFDLETAVRVDCHHEGCACDAFVAGGEVLSSTRE